MNHLQTLLNEIEAEAAQKSAEACANAALVELAGDICARINAAAEFDVCFPTWHLSPNHSRPSVTLQRHSGTSEADLITALELAGFAIEQTPARLCSLDRQRVYLMIAPGVDVLLHSLPLAIYSDANIEPLPEAA
jgi:hypothetical protein